MLAVFNFFKPAVRPTAHILMPVCNDAKVILTALDCIFKQRYTGNIRLFIMDNASTDDTQSIINTYVLAHPEIKEKCDITPIKTTKDEMSVRTALMNKSMEVDRNARTLWACPKQPFLDEQFVEKYIIDTEISWSGVAAWMACS